MLFICIFLNTNKFGFHFVFVIWMTNKHSNYSVNCCVNWIRFSCIWQKNQMLLLEYMGSELTWLYLAAREAEKL